MSGLITCGYGSKNLIITRGFGKWRIEVEVIPPIRPGLPPVYRIKIFKMEVPVKGDVSHDFYKQIEVRGIVDFHKLLLMLEDEEPSEEDELLKLLDLYNELKLRIKWEEVVDQEDIEMFQECKRRITEMMKKIKEEKA